MTATDKKINEHISVIGKVHPETEECKEGTTQDPVGSNMPPARNFLHNKQTSPEGNTASATGVAQDGELSSTETFTESSQDEMQMNEEPAIEDSKE